MLKHFKTLIRRVSLYTSTYLPKSIHGKYLIKCFMYKYCLLCVEGGGGGRCCILVSVWFYELASEKVSAMFMHRVLNVFNFLAEYKITSLHDKIDKL